MKNHLYIKVNDKWNEVDMFNDISIPITLKLTDIREFGSKSSGYSLDFNIPHTNNNAQLFGLNSDIDVYRGSFEVGKNYDAYLTDGCFTTFQGQFRLKKVVKQNSGKYIFYVGYLYGGTKTFIDKLGTSTLIGNEDASLDLNFDEYNTPAEEMNLADFVGRLQMHDTAGEDWALTLIDKTNKANQAFSGGSQLWYTDECTPYLGAMGIFNRIVNNTGYQYTSKFLMGNDGNNYLTGDDRWKNTIGKYDVYSMIYPYMRHNSNIRVLNPSYNTVYQTDANSNCNLVSSNYYVSYDLDWFYVLNGSNNVWTCNFDDTQYGITNGGDSSAELSSWRFEAPSYGIYKVDINLPFNIRMRFWNEYTQTWYTGTSENSVNMTYDWQVRIMKNSSTLALANGGDNYPSTYTVQSDGYVYLSGNESISYSGDIALRPGDSIQIYLYIGLQLHRSYWWEAGQQWMRSYAFFTNELTPHILTPKNISVHSLHSENDPIISITQQDGFYEGSPFYPNCILNPKTTKLEYFNEFVKMFNLYVEDVSGKKNYETGGIYPDKCLRIEPYECFYAPRVEKDQTNIKDWTKKIDWNIVEYMRIEDYLYNTQNFTKTQNKDYFNEQYDSTYIMPYGDRTVKGPYCTGDEKNEIALKSGGYLCGVVNSSTDVLQCPKVFTLSKNGSVDTKKEYSDGLFFLWRNYMQQNTETSNYTLKLQSRLSSGSGSYQNMTDYFCADTLNKGYGVDDANLNWGSTEDYYQNTKGTAPTYNDLYSAFYKKQYDEFTSPDARIMKANAYLTAFDIATLQLSDSILIDDHLWRILEIKQWRDEKTPCEVELIKVLDGIYKPQVNEYIPPVEPGIEDDPVVIK